MAENIENLNKSDKYEKKITLSKSEKFVKLANIRVKNAVRHLKLVQNLANSYNYDYSEEQAKKIMGAIKFEYDALVAEFKKGLSREKGGFKL